MIVMRAARASAILYSLLTSGSVKRPWLMPANICPIVPITFFKAKIPIELVDINPHTLNMDLDTAEKRTMTGHYGGILYAHTYGETSTPESFFRSIKSRSPELILIDDRCLTTPDLDPSPVNSADVVLYSTGYAKVVELSFGGYAYINESILYQHAVLPFSPNSHDEMEKSYQATIRDHQKYNYADSDWLDTSLNLPSWYDYRRQIEDNRTQSLEHRMELNKIYTAELPNEIQLPEKFQNWRFNLRVKNQEAVLNAIFAAGLFASAHYASLAGIMTSDEAPQAGKLASQVVNLFNDHHFTAVQAVSICRIITENLA
ncbi:MAG: hypothetical protein A2Y54_09220 [Chloroflexi bacterium RBG_16_51_16]|nr:MAG: hypothetical protein A2Y54_09220 [Chloroflexi bacterium RBG_16_51_16]